MATERVTKAPKKGFMDLPPELRNQIYETFVSFYTDRLRITPNELSKDACQSILHLVKALNLKHYFPFLLANKRIMHEAITLCLRTCSLHLQNLDQLNVVRTLRRNSDFQPIANNIRALELNISWYGHGIEQTREHTPTVLNGIQTLIPLTGVQNRHYRPLQNPSRPRSFAYLSEELRRYFPNTEHICIQLDKFTTALQFEIKSNLLGITRPTLRGVKFRRPDLERQFVSSMRRHVIFHSDTRHASGFWPPQAIPWQIEMDCRFLDSVNEGLEKAMLKKREDVEALRDAYASVEDVQAKNEGCAIGSD